MTNIYFQLRYLQTLNNISAEKNSTIVFPVPIDIISHMMGGKGQAPPEDYDAYDAPPPPRNPIETVVH